MGNYARLRTIYLRDRTVSSLGFTDRIMFPLADLIRASDGSALFIATPSEGHPEAARYAPGTYVGWKYRGSLATQYWRCPAPLDGLFGAINARYVYWNSESPIPGGVAIENFELIEPFSEGSKYWFGVTTKRPNAIYNSAPLLGGKSSSSTDTVPGGSGNHTCKRGLEEDMT